jgi:hypothetical protein
MSPSPGDHDLAYGILDERGWSAMPFIDRLGRLLSFVIARYGGRQWIVEGDLMHGFWHGSLVTYGAFRDGGARPHYRQGSAPSTFLAL